ncbi:SGNH hydrolase [Rugosimonospora africana]|uniref:SGNH hydrolase n=2 Tax=Rugosimonospora africana TaxID=556532 RepID=A0A8J3VUN4_9ACTN|nr:SGNH hydrolase [Rugosimonospora africana]
MRWAAAAVAAATLVTGLIGAGIAQADPVAKKEPAARTDWVATWATAAEVPFSGQQLAGFTDTTLRERIHVSIGGDVVRLRLTNVYGKTPLVVQSTTLGRPGGTPGDVDAASLVPVTFDGATSVTIPPGAEYASDPVRISVPGDGNLMASLYLPGPTGPATYHRDAWTTGYLAAGDQTGQPTVASFPSRISNFYFLDGLDVESTMDGSVAFLGDSITDGTHSTVDADHRWPDYLADRMLTQPRSRQFGVVNSGIAGNRLLLDYTGAGQGVNALARLERDVLTQTGVRTVFVFEGINDLQNDPTQYDPNQFIQAYHQIIQRAHDQGIRVVASTITPWAGWTAWTPEREAVRVQVNQWIRTSGEFDGVVDFDKVIRDPADPQRILPAYDSGDHLHPGDVGYKAMADAVNLDLLRP